MKDGSVAGGAVKLAVAVAVESKNPSEPANGGAFGLIAVWLLRTEEPYNPDRLRVVYYALCARCSQPLRRRASAKVRRLAERCERAILDPTRPPLRVRRPGREEAGR